MVNRETSVAYKWTDVFGSRGREFVLSLCCADGHLPAKAQPTTPDFKRPSHHSPNQNSRAQPRLAQFNNPHERTRDNGFTIRNYRTHSTEPLSAPSERTVLVWPEGGAPVSRHPSRAQRHQQTKDWSRDKVVCGFSDVLVLY